MYLLTTVVTFRFYCGMLLTSASRSHNICLLLVSYYIIVRCDCREINETESQILWYQESCYLSHMKSPCDVIDIPLNRKTYELRFPYTDYSPLKVNVLYTRMVSEASYKTAYVSFYTHTYTTHSSYIHTHK